MLKFTILNCDKDVRLVDYLVVEALYLSVRATLRNFLFIMEDNELVHFLVTLGFKGIDIMFHFPTEQDLIVTMVKNFEDIVTLMSSISRPLYKVLKCYYYSLIQIEKIQTTFR